MWVSLSRKNGAPLYFLNHHILERDCEMHHRRYLKLGALNSGRHNNIYGLANDYYIIIIIQTGRERSRVKPGEPIGIDMRLSG